MDNDDKLLLASLTSREYLMQAMVDAIEEHDELLRTISTCEKRADVIKKEIKKIELALNGGRKNE